MKGFYYLDSNVCMYFIVWKEIRERFVCVWRLKKKRDFVSILKNILLLIYWQNILQFKFLS